jgi:2-dehydropantoate 2-reductase
MHLHVVGLGSVGSFLAHHLRRALPFDVPITLVHKLPTDAQRTLLAGNIVRVERDGVLIPSTGYRVDAFDDLPPSSRAPSDSKQNWGDQMGFSGPIHSLFVTTKAQDAVSALKKLAPRLSAESTIVLLQNGMGVYEELSNRVFRNPEQRPHFILASNTHGIYTKGFHHVVHIGAGNIEFGIVPNPSRNFEASLGNPSAPPYSNNLQLDDITHPRDTEYTRYKSLRDTVATLLLLDSLDTKWRPMHEMNITLRRKLVVNSVINPLTALLGCRNGDLLFSPAAERLTSLLCREAFLAFKEEFQAETNLWFEDLQAQGETTDDVHASRLPASLTQTSLEQEVKKVANATKGNISSMLSDVRLGRRTEIDWINGYLYKLGLKYDVWMPTNLALLNLVKLRSHIPLDQQL